MSTAIYSSRPSSSHPNTPFPPKARSSHELLSRRLTKVLLLPARESRQHLVPRSRGTDQSRRAHQVRIGVFVLSALSAVFGAANAYVYWYVVVRESQPFVLSVVRPRLMRGRDTRDRQAWHRRRQHEQPQRPQWDLVPKRNDVRRYKYTITVGGAG